MVAAADRLLAERSRSCGCLQKTAGALESFAFWYSVEMQWITLLGTALGAVIGLGSALLNDMLRYRRDQQNHHRSVRQELYSEFLSVLTDAHESMRAASQKNYESTAGRESSIHDLFRACYRMRYQISIIAEHGVIDRSEAAFRKMHDIRDLLSQGESLESAHYKELRTEWGTLLRQLQNSTRVELGTGRVALSGGS